MTILSPPAVMAGGDRNLSGDLYDQIYPLLGRYGFAGCSGGLYDNEVR